MGTVKRQTALFIRLAETHYKDRQGAAGVNKTPWRQDGGEKKNKAQS